ncbi:hypothetical protein GOP47_0026217 [Adiantum capillus-veneris]|nr:hypothetical protein GOP47_0026217 [Adiantum capillus-veneris]
MHGDSPRAAHCGEGGHGCSKKCRRALFDLCLAQQNPHLDMFGQRPSTKFTGGLWNKHEDAIWKHMNGIKFLCKLAKQKKEKKAHVEQWVEDFMHIEKPMFWVPPTNDDEDNGSNEDVAAPIADQMEERATLIGIKCKTKKGPKRSRVLKKELRSYGLAQNLKEYQDYHGYNLCKHM